MIIFVGIAIVLVVILMIFDFKLELDMINKIPKAKCEQCEHCELIRNNAEIICDVYSQQGSCSILRPKRCSNFQRREKNE